MTNSFFKIQPEGDAITGAQIAHRSLRITFPLRCAASRRKLVNAAVVVGAAVNSRAVKISESIDDHAIVGKPAVWRTRERMNDALSPLPAAYRSELEDCASPSTAFARA